MTPPFDRVRKPPRPRAEIEKDIAIAEQAVALAEDELQDAEDDLAQLEAELAAAPPEDSADEELGYARRDLRQLPLFLSDRENAIPIAPNFASPMKLAACLGFQCPVADCRRHNREAEFPRSCHAGGGGRVEWDRAGGGGVWGGGAGERAQSRRGGRYRTGSRRRPMV